MLRNLFFGALACLAALNIFIHPHEPHFGLDAYPGFWALFGLIGAILLARLAKGAAHTFLGKDEDYYDKGSEGARGQGAGGSQDPKAVHHG
jgi:hypothetical protein